LITQARYNKKEWAMKKMTGALALAAVLWVGTTLAETYGWDAGNGTWDTTSANWSGAGTIWVDAVGNDVFFTNTASVTMIGVDGSRTAGIVKVGNSTANANFIFTNGTLNASTFFVRGSGNRLTGASTPTMFSDDVTVNVTGNISVSRWTLVMGGNSIINVDGVIGGNVDGNDGVWGTLTIQDSAVVTATGGVSANISYWKLTLNGGTLITKSILSSDTTQYGGGQVIFNGTVVKPTQDRENFIMLAGSPNDGFTSSAFISNNDAIFDTDGKNIGIGINLKPIGSGGLTKLGNGTLTLSGTNTYSGTTIVSGGTLKVYEAALPPSSTVAIAATGVLDLAGTSNTVDNLSGKGMVSNGVLTVTGIVMPGGTNILGTLSVSSGLVMTGTLLVDVEADNTNDVLAVQGNVDLSNATLMLDPAATLNTNRSYTFLTCTDTLSRFENVSIPDGWTLRYDNGAVRLVASSAVTFSWDTGDGIWDTTSANWLGAGTTWVDNGDVFFTNTASVTTITVDGSRLADAVMCGNGTDNNKYIFTGGTLDVFAFRVQGRGDKYAGLLNPTLFSNITVNASGNMVVGRGTLAMGGSSIVNVDGKIGGDLDGYYGVWGTFTIQDDAVVTVDEGVDGNNNYWELNLNGGTLITPSIRASDTTLYGGVHISFNGTVIKPTQDTNDFVTLSSLVSQGNTSSTLVGDGGAIFDTDGKNIGIDIGLKTAGSGGLTKLGMGTLTLSATNHTYTGATTISGGSLSVSSDNAATGAVLIANASFETYDGAALIPDYTPDAYRYSPSGAGWTFTGGGGITTSNSYFMIKQPGSDGACAAMLYGVSSFSQTVIVATAGLYDLRFMALKGRNYAFNSLVVTIDDSPVCSYGSRTLEDHLFNDFLTKGIWLAAGDHTLCFQGLETGTTYATVIDNVTLTPAEGGRLPDSTAVNLTASGVSYLQGRSEQTIGSLAGVAGSCVTNKGTLTVGGNNTTTTFAGDVSGSGSLVKTGSGILTLSGANTYTGATVVAEGTLEISASDTLSTNTTVEISAGAVLKLSNTSEQSVAALTINGVPKYRGTWGAPGSGAYFTRPQFSGTGILRVLTGLSNPGMIILIQ
jgi:fibronectin-binding autotransporter adhesin